MAVVEHRRATRKSGAKWGDGVARIMLQSYDWQGALSTCEEVLRNDPEHLGALEVLAQAQWYGGHFAKVIETTSRLLRLNPLEPGYRYTRGMAYVSRGDLTLAMEDFRCALRQSNNAEFRSQVMNSLEAVEVWTEQVMAGGTVRTATKSYEFGTPLRAQSVFGARSGRVS